MSRNNTGNAIDSKAYADFEDNVANFDQWSISDADSFKDRKGEERLTLRGTERAGAGDTSIAVDAAARAVAAAGQVEADAEQIAQDAAQQAVADVVIAVDGAVQQAVDAADRAESAAVAAFVNADVYPDVASGLAAVVDDEQFQVVEGEEIVRYQRTGSTTAVPVARTLSADGVLSRVAGALSSPTLEASNPNLFTMKQAAAIDAEGKAAGGIILTERQGVPMWANSTAQAWGPFPRSLFSGDVMAASVNVVAIEGASPGTGIFRFILSQHTEADAGFASEIMEVRKEISLQVSDWKPGFLEIPNTTIHPDCVAVRVVIGMTAEGATCLYRDMLLCEGGNPTFRVSAETSSPEPEETVSLESVPSIAVSNPNLFSSAQAAALDKEGMVGSAVVQSIIGGIPHWQSTGTVYGWGPLFRSQISGDTMSAAVNIRSFDPLGGSSKVRVMLNQYSGTTILVAEEVARQEVILDEFTPGFVRFTDIAIHPDCQSIGIYIGSTSTAGGTIAYRDMLLCAGEDATFRVSSAAAVQSGSREVWVSPDGNNNGSGSASLPFATLARAVEELDGKGTIYLAAGDYDNQQISAYNVRDLKIVGGADSDFKRSLFRYGTELTLTSVAGRQGVYSAPLARTPHWLWVDDVPDEETLVPYNEQHSLLNGRAHRLACTKIWHIPAANLVDALDLIEASATPVCWRDASTNTVYLSLPDGASASSDVRAAFDETGLLSSTRPTWTPEHHIELVGIDVRYGQVRTKDFRTSKLTDVGVLGAAANGFVIGNWAELEQCRAGGVGSGDGLGDGFNAHNHANWTYKDCYGHDSWDDGESSHQNCRVTGRGNIMEYNLGGGFVPAYGAQEVLHNCLSRKNSVDLRGARIKRGGFTSVGDPTPTDPGIITSLEAYNCVSIGDRNGFYDGTTSVAPAQRRLLAVDCKVFDAEETAFACAEIRDCSESGSGQVKSSGTTVTNTTLIV